MARTPPRQPDAHLRRTNLDAVFGFSLDSNTQFSLGSLAEGGC